MGKFSIEFVPLNESLERRLQTFAAACWISAFVFGGFIGCVVTLLLIIYASVVRWFVILYLLYVYFFDWDTCDRGGWSDRWTHWMRNCSLWHYYCAYFPMKLVKTAELDPSKNYLLCCFPHGLMCAGIYGAFATDVLGFRKLYPGLRSTLLTLQQNFKQPLFREFLYSSGFCSASRESIEYLVSRPEGGKAAVLVVGGAEECRYCDDQNYRVILKKRKGYVRIALKHGTPLVPVISFGETDLYGQIHFAESSAERSFQDRFRKITGYTPMIPVGRGFFQYSFGLIPRRSAVTVVVGSPLEVPKISEPTLEDVTHYKTKFEESLKDLFETHKYKYLKNPEKQQLIIE